MNKRKRIILCIVLYYILYYLLYYFMTKINSSEKSIALISLVLPLIIAIAIYYLLKNIQQTSHEKVMSISENYKQLVELNNKYQFNDIGKIKRKVYEREYSHKSYDRARAKSIILYHIENNDNNIREFILNAYRNKKMYDNYLEEFEKINEKTAIEEIEKIGYNEKKFYKLEKEIINNNKVKDNVYKISINVIVEYTTPAGKNNYRKNRAVEYQELCDLYMQWRNGKKYEETSKRERAMMNDQLRYDVLKRDNYKCKICGASAQDGAKLHVDHIVPVSKGGKTTISNLQTLCDRCNIGKSNKTN